MALTTNILWQQDSLVNGATFHLEIVTTDSLPPLELTRAVCAYVFNDQNKLLLTKHSNPQRGWDIPGGHIEKGESVEETLIREFLEETGVLVKPLRVIAQMVFNVQSPKPTNYRYPYPTSYTPIFFAEVQQINQFKVQPDAIDQGFFDLEQMTTIAHSDGWLNQHQALYHLALKQKEIYDQPTEY